MAISDLLTKLTDDVRDSYSAVEEKGGTLPEHKNTDNLPDAIRSIEGGGSSDPEFGEVVLYGYTVSETVIDGVSPDYTITVRDEEQLKQLTDMNMLPIVVSVSGENLDYFDTWTIEATDAMGESVYMLGDPNMFNNIFEVSADPRPSENFSFEFTIESIGEVSIDTSTTTKRTLTSVTEFNKLASANTEFVLDNVPKLAVKEAKIGYSIVSIPNSFLDGCESVDTLSFSENSSVTTIGNRFGRRIGNFSGRVKEVKLPEGITSIGNDFLLQAKIDGMVTLPKTLTSIGSSFMSGAIILCPIMIPPRVTTIGGHFLESSSVEAPVHFQGVPTSIGVYFMYNCVRMTSTLYINNVPATAFASSDYTLAVSANTWPAYKIGIPIKGIDSANFVAKFADSSASMRYRKLIDRGAY